VKGGEVWESEGKMRGWGDSKDERQIRGDRREKRGGMRDWEGTIGGEGGGRQEEGGRIGRIKSSRWKVGAKQDRRKKGEE